MRFFATLFLLCSALLLWGAMNWQQAQQKPLPGASQNVNLGYFSSQSLVVGDAVAMMNSHASIVNVFASWCTPCIAELPHLRALKEASNLPIIGVAWNVKDAVLCAWLRKYGNPFDAVYHDSRGKWAAGLSIQGIPETFLIDSSGQLLYRHRGPITDADLKPFLEHIAKASD